MSRQHRNLVIILILFLISTAACSSQEYRILLDADGERRWVTTEGETVGDLLKQEDIVLDDNDRAEPPAYTPLENEMQVSVIRVREQLVDEQRTVPYQRQVRRDATLRRGETRVVQLGENGAEVITWRVRYENGVETERDIAEREQVEAPQPEVLVVGTLGSVETVSIAGTIVYLAGGNAWVLRDTNTPRALTRTGDLDGHVFSLSPDGRWLLFTRTPIGGSAGQAGPINSLWLVRTDIVDDEPANLDVASVLWADWHPCPVDAEDCLNDIGYSTAERTPSPPGWKANNDLWLITLSERGEPVAPRRVKEPTGAEWYAWWGREWSWSPDGKRIAWGGATNLGFFTPLTSNQTTLTTFSPYETVANWVWTPKPTWRPDGRWIAATVHAPPAGQERPARGERFDLWLLPMSVSSPPVQLAGDVGMWARPSWSPDGKLAYLQAEDPRGSATSRYALITADADGSNRRRLFPDAGTPGIDVPRLTWSPDSAALLAIWQGDLYRVATDGTATPLTATGNVTQFDWQR